MSINENSSPIPASIEHEMLGTVRVPGYADVLAAAERMRPYIRRTMLLRSPKLDQLAGAPVWIKPENLQVTSSFKARGAFNALLNLPQAARARGVVAYSTGNHGQAVSYAASVLGIPATIVMPVDAPKNKVEKALNFGARVVQYDRTRESREAIGMKLMEESGATLVPPGDHPDVLAAQGTLALEVMQDLPEDARANLGMIAMACGGGGMSAGCALVLQELAPSVRQIAVEPAGYDDTVRSLAAGYRIANEPGAHTLCDALAAAIPAELPYAINSRRLDAAVAVTDEEVGVAIRFALEELRLVVEPGGAVALAALLAGKISTEGKDAVIVLSGGNIDSPLLARLVQEAA